jgi:hypothetical protein
MRRAPQQYGLLAVNKVNASRWFQVFLRFLQGIVNSNMSKQNHNMTSTSKKSTPKPKEQTKTTGKKSSKQLVVSSTTKPSALEIISFFKKVVSGSQDCLLSRLGDLFEPHFGMTIQTATNMSLRKFIDTNNQVFGTQQNGTVVTVFLKPVTVDLPTQKATPKVTVAAVPSSQEIETFFKNTISTNKIGLSVLSNKFLLKFGKRFDLVSRIKIQKYFKNNSAFTVEQGKDDLVISLKPVSVISTKPKKKTPTNEEIVEFFTNILRTKAMPMSLVATEFQKTYGKFKSITGTKIGDFFEKNKQKFQVGEKNGAPHVSLVSNVDKRPAVIVPVQGPKAKPVAKQPVKEPSVATVTHQPKKNNHLPPTVMGDRFVIIPIISSSNQTIVPAHATTSKRTESKLPTSSQQQVVSKNKLNEHDLDERFYSTEGRYIALHKNKRRMEKEEIKEQAYYKKLSENPAMDPLVKFRDFPTRKFGYSNSYNVTTETSMSKICEWIQKNVIRSKCTVVGMDVEFDCVQFSATGALENRNTADVITIATDSACLIIQTYKEVKPCDPAVLVGFLTNPAITKVFCGVHSDVVRVITWLSECYAQYPSIKPFVTHAKAERKNMGYFDLESLPYRGLKIACRRYLGCDLEKYLYATFSRWSSRHLDSNQIRYAAEDALCTREIYMVSAKTQSLLNDHDCSVIEEEIIRQVERESEDEFIEGSKKIWLDKEKQKLAENLAQSKTALEYETRLEEMQKKQGLDFADFENSIREQEQQKGCQLN